MMALDAKRDQMAACQDWQKTELPNDYFKPFRLDTPGRPRLRRSGRQRIKGEMGQRGSLIHA